MPAEIKFEDMSFFSRVLFATVIGVTGIFAARDAFSDPLVSSPAVYKPDITHESDPLEETTVAWDASMKTTNVPADSANACFIFSFTNVTRFPVTILDARPSCYCTTVQTPPLPWTIPPGTNAQIGVNVDLEGKYGEVIKSVDVGTDKGSRELVVQINILPPVIPVLTDADRIRQMQVARADRQAVFKNDCVICHVKPGEDKYGKALFDADCAICHEAEHRASMVPDLHSLKVATGDEFWRTWIAHGKPGTFMPAFAESDGGPLSDMQISSLAAYLNYAIPSKAPTPQ